MGLVVILRHHRTILIDLDISFPRTIYAFRQATGGTFYDILCDARVLLDSGMESVVVVVEYSTTHLCVRVAELYYLRQRRVVRNVQHVPLECFPYPFSDGVPRKRWVLVALRVSQSFHTELALSQCRAFYGSGIYRASIAILLHCFAECVGHV